MIFKIDGSNMKEICKVPHEHEYKKNIKDLNKTDPTAFNKIFTELNRLIDTDEIHTSSWIPGSDWNNTVFHPIYESCKFNESKAAKFFGQILFDIIMQRSDKWSFGRYEVKGVQINGLTYFKIN